MICEQVENILDAYISNELLVETCAKVNFHLAGCAECATAVEIRCQVKAALQRAAARVLVPARLPARVRWRVRQAWLF